MEKILDCIKNNLGVIFSNSFFTTLQHVAITENQWKQFFVQKYGSVGYFLEFLLKGSVLCEPHSKELSEIFLHNYNDEIGFIDGRQQEDYRHENWRLKSLKEFGITSNDLEKTVLIPSTQLHSDLLATLPKGHDFLEYCGALLFLEIFVAQEMRHLIKAFERTIPQHFPLDGYDKGKAPTNTHEYWYNHMDHDPHHFREIKEGLERFLAKSTEKETENYSRIIRGVEKCFVAKMHLYDSSLMTHILHS